MEIISSRLFLSVAGVVTVLVALTYKSGFIVGVLSNINNEQQHQQRRQQSSLRQLSIDEYSDPKTTDQAIRPDQEEDNPSIRFYIKASGKEKYLARAKHIADTWAKDVDDITFLMDDSNHEEVDEAFSTRKWAKVKHVKGTDKQGEYKHATGRYDPILKVAWAAQRLKTRAVFTEEEEQNSPVDWVCYIDDDMVVNVSNLKKELLKKESECAPDCIIGDQKVHGGTKFTAGGWCMNQDLVQRTTTLLKQKTDDELFWRSTDDVSFHHAVMNVALDVVVTDSLLFFSEISWHRRSAKYNSHVQSQNITGTLMEFVENVSPILAVYHNGLEPKSIRPLEDLVVKEGITEEGTEVTVKRGIMDT